MARGTVHLELSIAEMKVIENALENYKGRLIFLSKNQEGSFEKYQDIIQEEKVLDKLTKDLKR